MQAWGELRRSAGDRFPRATRRYRDGGVPRSDDPVEGVDQDIGNPVEGMDGAVLV